jgi:hypothetical protein
MEDDWEDWENKEIPIIFSNEEQIKRINEQKLIEESDAILTKSLFSNEEPLKLDQYECQQKTVTNILLTNEKKHSKQKQNEEKQKLLAKKIKAIKEKKDKERELFGEATEDNEYDKFEDMLHR